MKQPANSFLVEKSDQGFSFEQTASFDVSCYFIIRKSVQYSGML